MKTYLKLISQMIRVFLLNLTHRMKIFVHSVTPIYHLNKTNQIIIHKYILSIFNVFTWADIENLSLS